MREDIKINDRALALEKSLIEKLELVFDTDVELDVYNLGLIYEIHLDEAGTCKVVMTFTDTACSCAESLPIEIVSRLFGNPIHNKKRGTPALPPESVPRFL